MHDLTKAALYQLWLDGKYQVWKDGKTDPTKIDFEYIKDIYGQELTVKHYITKALWLSDDMRLSYIKRFDKYLGDKYA